jgi:hypothetical protein
VLELMRRRERAKDSQARLAQRAAAAAAAEALRGGVCIDRASYEDATQDYESARGGAEYKHLKSISAKVPLQMLVQHHGGRLDLAPEDWTAAEGLCDIRLSPDSESILHVDYSVAGHAYHCDINSSERLVLPSAEHKGRRVQSGKAPGAGGAAAT